MDVLFEVFGEQRLLWGSDWPVCLLASSYEKWLKVVEVYLESNSVDKEGVFGGNAGRDMGFDL